MGNLQSLEREGSLTKAELDRLERRLKKLGRGRAEVARSDLKTLDGLGQNNFVERIFQMFDEGENQMPMASHNVVSFDVAIAVPVICAMSTTDYLGMESGDHPSLPATSKVRTIPILSSLIILLTCR
jgi:hypothetical protein